jgi:Protein of unknown function (DUF1579)
MRSVFTPSSLCRLLLLASCCVSGIVSAQAPQTPGPEHARLKEMVGQWDAIMDMGGQKSKATASYKSICGGMWIASEFESEFGGAPFQGHGLDGYDQVKKQYTSYWFDSMTSGAMTLVGNYDANNKVITMSGESSGPDGSPQKFRTTTEMNGPDSMTFKMYMVSTDGKEELSFTITYSRRK